MLTFFTSAVTVVTSEYKELAVAFLAGFASVRAWFAKEIAAGKAELKKIVTAVDNDAKAVVADIKKI